MGVKKCHVEGCASSSNRVEDTGVTFHVLPQNPQVRATWITASRVIDDPTVPGKVWVCSRHFRQADFRLNKTKYLLVRGAYPSIFPWGTYTHVADPPPTVLASSVPPTPKDAPAAAPVAKEPVKAKPIKLKKDLVVAKRHSIAVETINKAPDSPAKVQLRKSMESAAAVIVAPPPKKEPELVKKFDPVPGKLIEAMDFHNVWHKANIVEVDPVERELLIHFEENNKEKLVDEWIPMDSSRLRALMEPVAKPAVEPGAGPSSAVVGRVGDKTIFDFAEITSKFIVGERCLARWSDSRKFRATIQKVLPNGLYEVLFDDGFLKTVKLKHISKLKTNGPAVKGPPLPQVNLVNGEEWYCQWVDDCPVGTLTTVDTIVPGIKLRMIEVVDVRLPAGWTKFFAERHNVGNKWDVVIVSPSGRRFRGRPEVKTFLEETGNTEIQMGDIDFAMHKKRSKEKGVYTYTESYRKFLKAMYPSMTDTDTIPPTPPDVEQALLAQLPLLEPLPEVMIRDWIMVDGMKVQIIDNLLRCPEEGCFKNFRKEDLLRIHIKHYHEAMARKITAPPTMTDLAYKRQQVGEDSPILQVETALSPTRSVRRNVDKTKPEVKLEGGVVIKEEILDEPSILELALNAKGATKMEDMSHRVYPKATPLSASSGDGVMKKKRKYTRRTTEFDSPKPLAKKIKLEQLDHVGVMVDEGGEDLGIDGLSPMVPMAPQEYINENGEVIKIVRMRQEEIINCLCRYPEEDGLMIQCDLCLCWQHGPCNDIEKESQVPEKYVCYICRNPEKGRQSMKYIHDQDWLYDGKLPRGTYHTQGVATDAKRTDTLKKVHTLTGNLLELKRLMHSLQVKMSIADNKDHPKLYLWSKRWEDVEESASPQKGGAKDEGPKPEAAIDSTECQRRLMDHIKHVQSQLNSRLDAIEKQVDEIEEESELAPMDENEPRIKQSIHMMMDDLATMEAIAEC